ncbi:MAG: c-type cytochrome [Gemmatimonadota bacterium]|nr:c-type cytochrome [Gemmatimonadota bacterium]
MHALWYHRSARRFRTAGGRSRPAGPGRAAVIVDFRERTTIRRAALISLVALAACRGADAVRPAGGVEPEAMSGGAMTVFDSSARAFGLPGPGVAGAELAEHAAGDDAFEVPFVLAPAPVHPGLGPRFDNESCAGCHRNDGRGRPPAPGEPVASMLFRVSVPGANTHGGPLAAPGFGTQLELRAAPGLVPVAVMALQYSDSVVSLADGAADTLRVPHYAIGAPYRALPAGLMLSPRVAPPNFGLGLLEAVPASAIEALARAPAAVAAGVAGRANYVWDPTVQQTVLGRFGLKANVGSLLEQTARALNQDIGITSSLFPVEPCDDPIPGCAPHAFDAPDSLLRVLTAYVRTLGVPARRGVAAAAVRRGQALFASAGCALCHVPTLETGAVAGSPELSGQTIHPYTDLLLHDMGPGLADGRPDYLASGAEWRTPPLWGIGLTATVNGNVNFLHDGRARTLLEAILWHGGQGAAARDAVRRMSKADRDALIAFLMSL